MKVRLMELGINELCCQIVEIKNPLYDHEVLFLC